VDQIDNSVNPKTQKGKPQKKIRTDKNQWVMVTGDGAEQIVLGSKIEISEPKPYGKNNTLYATLQSIEISNSMPKPPERAYRAGPAEQAMLTTTTPAPNGAKPSNGKISWLEFASFFKATHEMLREVEPDSELETGIIDRSAARATMMNTCVMAFEHGRIEAPDVPDTDDDPTPF